MITFCRYKSISLFFSCDASNFFAPQTYNFRAKKVAKGEELTARDHNRSDFATDDFSRISPEVTFIFFILMKSTTMTCSARFCHNYSSALAAVYKPALNKAVSRQLIKSLRLHCKTRQTFRSIAATMLMN